MALHGAEGRPKWANASDMRDICQCVTNYMKRFRVFFVVFIDGVVGGKMLLGSAFDAPDYELYVHQNENEEDDDAQ